MGRFTEDYPIFLEDTGGTTGGMHSFPFLQRQKDSYFRCYRCKYPLAPASASFTISGNHFPINSCTHIFLCSPMSWMTDQIDTTSPGGKLFCPNCNDARGPNYVGEYCWFGIQCQNPTCGEIVSPGLALIKSLEDGEIPGVEFQRVAEGSVDSGEVSSSQETVRDDDCVDEQDDNEIRPEAEQIEERHDEAGIGFQSFLSDATEMAAITNEEDIQTYSYQQQEREVTPPQQSRRGTPSNITTTQSAQRISDNQRHLPAVSSPLRECWFPPSAHSSEDGSQASHSSTILESGESPTGEDINYVWSPSELTDDDAPYDNDHIWMENEELE